MNQDALTHQDWDEMAANFQMACSNTFPFFKNIVF